MSFTLERNTEIYNKLIQTCVNDNQKVYWKWFVSLSEVPRPSYHCKPFSQWILQQASQLELKSNIDKSDNVCVHIPPSPGYENSPHVIIQAHIDMVENVIDGKTFDFKTTPITLLVDGNIITADGTTLGADDGAGLACLFTLMEIHKSFEHAGIECLFTVDEEPGLLGALELKEGELFESAKYFINVDSEEWGECTISSAGCAQREMSVKIEREIVKGDYVTFAVEGFKGGHTGAEIHTQRANALKWIVDILLNENPFKQHLRIVHFNSGHVDNAIPTKGRVGIIVPNGNELKEKVLRYHNAYSILYTEAEENPKIEITVEQNVEKNALTLTHTANLLHLLKCIPHGVVRFSPDVDNLTETSTSLSIARIEETENELFICTLSRSADNEYLKCITESVEKIAKNHGAQITIPTPDIGGWPANPHCRLLDEIKRVYKKMFNQEMAVTACHGGLENSIILNQYPSMKLESISIGPTCRDVHTPNEIMEIDTANKLVDLVCRLLAALK